MDSISEEEKDITISNFKYDKEKIRRVLSKLIIVDEKSFCLLESKSFNLHSKALQPRHKNWSRQSIKGECMTIYAEGKENLKEELKGGAITWTLKNMSDTSMLRSHKVFFSQLR